MLRAWFTGFAILSIAYGLWFGSLRLEQYSQPLVALLWIAPALSAGAVAYLAPRGKFAMGLSMAIPAPIIAAGLNAVASSAGLSGDFGGFRGAFTLFAMTLATSAVLAAIGAAIGWWASRKRRP